MAEIQDEKSTGNLSINKKRFTLVKNFIIINSYLPLEAFLAPVVVLYYLQYMKISLWNYSNFISALFILNMLLEIPLGIISDKLGWNKSYLIGKSLYFTGLLLLMLYPGETVLIPSAILLSTGASLSSGNLESIAYDASAKSGNQDSYRPMLKKASSIGIIVSAFASICGGYLATKNIMYPMLADIIALAIGVILSIIYLKILWPGKDITIEKKHDKPGEKINNLLNVKNILFIPDFLFPC